MQPHVIAEASSLNAVATAVAAAAAGSRKRTRTETNEELFMVFVAACRSFFSPISMSISIGLTISQDSATFIAG